MWKEQIYVQKQRKNGSKIIDQLNATENIELSAGETEKFGTEITKV